jgi:glycosyltransferase involved in cell wall biosynthesis
LDNHTENGRILAISNLFPNRFEPRRGLFNLNQFSALAAAGAGVKVVAPVPAFPGMNLLPRLSSSGRAARVPDSDVVDGLEVWYPRYAYLPVIGREIHGQLYYRGTKKRIGRIVGQWRPDILYVTWTWPDAYAVCRIARDLGLPVVVKVHGTDINEYLDYRGRRDRILTTLRNADAVVSVSGALKKKMADNGVDSAKIHVIYNGVDRGKYRPRPRDDCRDRLGIAPDVPTVVFVGNLKPVKGLDTLIAAVSILRDRRADVRLHLVGRGPLEPDLRRMATEAGLGQSVRFEGERSPEEVARWMNAADVLCLPSVNEGVPNVLLEAMACGTPVVASGVGGIPEVVEPGKCGYLLVPGDPEALATALDKTIAARWERDEIRRHTERFTWEKNAELLRGVLEKAAKDHG